MILNSTGTATRRTRFRCTVALGVVIACSAAPLCVNTSGQQGAPDTAELVRPFVNESTCLVLKVDLQPIGVPDLPEALKKLSPGAQQTYQQGARAVEAMLAELRGVLGDRPVLATAGLPTSPQRVPVFVFVQRSADAADRKVLDYLRQKFETEGHVVGEDLQWLVTSPTSRMPVTELLAAFPASPRPQLAAAFAAVADDPVQVLLLPPPYVRRTIDELMPVLPDQLGGGPSGVLTEGLQWAALGIDLVQLQARVVIQSASDQAARTLADRLPAMLRSAYQAARPIHEQVPADIAQSLIETLEPQVDGQQITIRMDGRQQTEANLRLLALLARRLEESARQHRNERRLKQIMLAIHNYYDTFRSFPPLDRHRDENGQHRLSWRVHILPFLEEAALYEKFRLDEPWDSPHNRPLLNEMPDVYQSRSFSLAPQPAIQPGYTTFVAPVGEDTAFGGKTAVKFSDFRDGTSNTVVLVEVKPSQAVPWTAPQDHDFDPEKPAAGLLIGEDGRWLCAFADGSVHQLRGDIPPQTLLNLFRINDGQVVDYRSLR